MKILVPVDFNKSSFSAFKYACNFANQFNADITLIHVISGSFTTNHVLAFDPLLSLEDAAIKRLNYFAIQYAKDVDERLPDVNISKEIAYGIPGIAISEFAKNHHFDLIIMGTKDKHGIFDRIIGSTSTITLRQGSCPVILIHEHTKFNNIKKVAFAIDNKVELDDSIESYRRLNNTWKAKTDFVHVDVSGSKDISEQMKDIIEELYEENDPNFSFEIKKIDGNNVQSALKSYCITEKMDLLVMVHYHEGIFANVFGANNSVMVAQELVLPVLVYPEDKD